MTYLVPSSPKSLYSQCLFAFFLVEVVESWKVYERMGLGILDDTHLEHVPGTALLTEIQAIHHPTSLEDTLPNVDTSGLKHNKSGTLVLVPQPCDSPNDPYNWPRLKKELFCVAYAFGCGAVGGILPAPRSY